MLDRIASTQRAAPTRVPVVLAALLVQLGAAACLVIGLAAIPMVHDLRQDPALLGGWIATAVVALACGGLAYRARIVPLFVAAIACAALGFVLPRGDSAIGVVAHMLPKGDISESIVVDASIAMFAIGAACLAVLPWAVPYRAWDRGEDASRPKQTLYGMAVAVPAASAIDSLRMLAARRRPWIAVAVIGVGVGVAAGFVIVRLFASDDARAASHVIAMPAEPAVAAPAAVAPHGGAATPQRLIVALDHLSAARPGAAGAFEAGSADLFDADAIVIGTEAADVATGSAAAALAARELAHDRGDGIDHALTVRATTVATDGSLAWFSQDLAIGDRRVALTAVAHEELGRWTIVALSLANPLSSESAAHLARTKQLAALAALPVPPKNAAPLVSAARDAFASRAAYADAVSVRPDALAVGRAGDRVTGGDDIRRAAVHHDTKLAVGTIAAHLVGARAGWTVATVTVGTGRTAEPMRVLAAWVHEDTGWRIVATHWSDGGPFH